MWNKTKKMSSVLRIFPAMVVKKPFFRKKRQKNAHKNAFVKVKKRQKQATEENALEKNKKTPKKRLLSLEKTKIFKKYDKKRFYWRHFDKKR